MEGRFSVRPDREHGNPFKPSIYLKMSPLFFVCPVRLKRGICTVRAKNLKKISKTCAFADHRGPLFGLTRSGARQHGNPLQPVRTRDGADKNLANGIVARFRRISTALRGRFPWIPSIFVESAVTRHDQYD